MMYLKDFDFKDKRTLVRVDFNVPLDEKGNVTDESRIEAALPTLEKIIQDGGKLIIMSHLGRPKGAPKESLSLQHIVPNLENLLNRKIQFSKEIVGENVQQKVDKLNKGEVLLLENLRFCREETQGDPDFAQQLAQLCEVYVNDAFGTAHRAHASTAVIADYVEDKVCGFIMEKELNVLNKVLKHPEKPFTTIIGGAKISDKIVVIEKLLEKVNSMIIGGGMAFTFIKALGGNIGKSLVEEQQLSLAKQLLEKAKQVQVDIYLPVDVVAAEKFDNQSNSKIVDAYHIPESWMGLDIGPRTCEIYKKAILKSKTILWNGPMGVFEMSNFAKGTQYVAECMVTATENGAFSVIGGGDSAAAIHQLQYADKVSYISTGGGAMLSYIEGKSLPALEKLKKTLTC